MNDIYRCIFFFQRFNADYELSAREGADTMAYIALIDEKLRPALVFGLLLSSTAGRCLMLLFRAVFLRSTVAHFLGGRRKLHQRDAALVCVALPFSAQLCRPWSPCQRRLLPHPSDQRRGSTSENHRGGGKGKPV